MSTALGDLKLGTVRRNSGIKCVNQFACTGHVRAPDDLNLDYVPFGSVHVRNSPTTPLESIENITAAFYLSTIALVSSTKKYDLDAILPQMVWLGGLEAIDSR